MIPSACMFSQFMQGNFALLSNEIKKKKKKRDRFAADGTFAQCAEDGFRLMAIASLMQIDERCSCGPSSGISICVRCSDGEKYESAISYRQMPQFIDGVQILVIFRCMF